MEAAVLNTAELIAAYFKDLAAQGKSPSTLRSYQTYLRHFEKEYLSLPTEPRDIEKFLRARHETPSKRGQVFRTVQAFYSWLERTRGVKSPVPPKGKVGRPPGQKAVITIVQPEPKTAVDNSPTKLVEGGSSVSNSTSISTTAAYEAYLTSRSSAGLSPRTIDDYRRFLRVFARKLPKLPLEPEPIESFLASIKGVPETIWDYWMCIKTMYKWLAERKGYPNPMLKVKMQHPKRKERKILTKEQMQKLVNMKMDPHERAIFDLLITTSIRSAELRTLSAENVYPTYIVVSGKTGGRKVAITPKVYEELRKLGKKGILFHGERGPLGMEGLYKIVRPRLEQVGAKNMKLGPHQLRHSAATYYLMAGGDLESLRQLLGHTNLSTTQIYSTMTQEMVHDRVNQVDLLGKLTVTPAGAASPVPAGLQGGSATARLPAETGPAGSNASPGTPPRRPDVVPAPRPSAAQAAAERAKGLSGWGDLLIIGPKKKPAPAPGPNETTGQLAFGL